MSSGGLCNFLPLRSCHRAGKNVSVPANLEFFHQTNTNFHYIFLLIPQMIPIIKFFIYFSCTNVFLCEIDFLCGYMRNFRCLSFSFFLLTPSGIHPSKCSLMTYDRAVYQRNIIKMFDDFFWSVLVIDWKISLLSSTLRLESSQTIIHHQKINRKCCNLNVLKQQNS